MQLGSVIVEVETARQKLQKVFEVPKGEGEARRILGRPKSMNLFMRLVAAVFFL
jgi:hypothetical protein